jgi:hypothetical protein
LNTAISTDDNRELEQLRSAYHEFRSWERQLLKVQGLPSFMYRASSLVAIRSKTYKARGKVFVTVGRLAPDCPKIFAAELGRMLIKACRRAQLRSVMVLR